MSSPVRIITISRQFAAGGSSLAAALGERLQWRVMDRELVAEVARRLQRPEADVRDVDEHALDPWARAAAYAASAFPEMPIPPLGAYLEAQVPPVVETVLRETAEREPMIAVGHGTQCIFSSRKDALHLRLIAPFEHRIDVAMTRLQVDRKEAERRVREEDDDRKQYMRQVHGIDVEDPRHYDLLINTRGLSIDDVAEIVLMVVRRRTA